MDSCPDLLGLRLKGLTKVTDRGMKDIGNVPYNNKPEADYSFSGKTNKLQLLDIEGCIGVTDHAITAILVTSFSVFVFLSRLT